MSAQGELSDGTLNNPDASTLFGDWMTAVLLVFRVFNIKYFCTIHCDGCKTRCPSTLEQITLQCFIMCINTCPHTYSPHGCAFLGFLDSQV